MGRKPNLTEEQAQEARDLYRDQNTVWTVAALARSFGVHTATMRAALDGKGAYRPAPSAPKKGKGDE